jgi:predicted small secreted protein
MKTFSSLAVALSACCALVAGCAASGAGQVRDFPPDAQTLSAQALKDRLSGRSFTVRLASGGSADLDYGADGRYRIRLSSGESDQGRWRAEDGRTCVTYEGRFPSGCSAVRATADRLYTQRASTGEVLLLIPRP